MNNGKLLSLLLAHRAQHSLWDLDWARDVSTNCLNKAVLINHKLRFFIYIYIYIILLHCFLARIFQKHVWVLRYNSVCYYLPTLLFLSLRQAPSNQQYVTHQSVYWSVQCTVVVVGYLPFGPQGISHFSLFSLVMKHQFQTISVFLLHRQTSLMHGLAFHQWNTNFSNEFVIFPSPLGFIR